MCTLCWTTHPADFLLCYLLLGVLPSSRFPRCVFKWDHSDYKSSECSPTRCRSTLSALETNSEAGHKVHGGTPKIHEESSRGDTFQSDIFSTEGPTTQFFPLLNIEKKKQNGQLFPPPFPSSALHSNGLNGTISVYPLEGSLAGMMPTAASANSPTAYTILDVDQNAYLFVGGIIGSVKVCCLCLCPCPCLFLCLCVCCLSAFKKSQDFKGKFCKVVSS